MINTLCSINKAANTDPAAFILACEQDYERQTDVLAKMIADNDDIKIVAIAGPSGSGKTTTAHILMRKLHTLDEKTAVVSLDDFYLPFELLPENPDGSKDFESVRAMDAPRISKAFSDLISTGCAYLPKFDFLTKSRLENARKIDIGHRGIAIVEGLHAMNPAITKGVSKENILKVYISINMPVLNGDGRQLISSRQLRLVRRILRDKKFRGAGVPETLELWDNVVKGESKYLYCFKDEADVKLTTFHAFEPCVYKEAFCKLRGDADEGTPCYDYFIKTADALEGFYAIDSELVPENSLIREFIGNKNNK